MSGEKNLATLLKTMKPHRNEGEYVFCTAKNDTPVNCNEILFHFREEEGSTIVLKKHIADQLSLNYPYVASWITLTVHSSLEAVGLTAAFSNALAKENISCNVVAAFYHDHIFVDIKEAEKAMEVLNRFSQTE